MGWEDNVRKVVPYTPGEQPRVKDIVKLNTNENPYPPSPRVAEAMKALAVNNLRLYPDPKAEVLVSAVAKAYGLPESEVFVGVGSDDVLAMLFMTFFNGREPVIFPDITYSFYDVWAEMLRIPYETIPLDENFKIVPGDYARPNGGIVFPNPNAPTGALLPLSLVEEIAAANPDSVVIVDEAYIDFGGESAVSLIERYENLLVVQTGSKSRAMAGLRVGWAFGSRMLIDALKAVKFSFNSYTMNSPAIALGAAAIRDVDYWKELCRRIISTRERLSSGLRELGFSFPESSANFLFAKHETISGEEVFQTLKARKIYVRHWNAPRIGDHLRITVGTEEETDALLAALQEIVG